MGRVFTANACHSDTVAALPLDAEVLARSAVDDHQVLRFGRRSWGVQFHPEFDGEVTRQYLDARAEAVVSEGLDLAVLQRRAKDTPDARVVFRNFVRHVIGQ